MRRLLQFGTLILILAGFLPPLFECFDRWDAPGLGNDTEMGLFFIVFFICLALVVCKLIASLVGRMSFRSVLLPGWDHLETFLDRIDSESIFVPPQLLTSLRI